METLQNVGDYFAGEDVPAVHPYQDVPKPIYLDNHNKGIKTKEEHFGYDKKPDPVNNNDSYKKIKKEK